METIVVAKLKDNNDAAMVERFLRKFSRKVKVMETVDLDKEDAFFAKLIDEGMKSGEVPLDEIYKELRK